MRWGRVRTTVGAALLGAALVGLGVFLAARDLDRADKWASVVSMVVGVAALAVAVLSLRAGRSGPGGVRVSMRVGRVDGAVTGVRGLPSADDLDVDLRARGVGRGGSVIGIDSGRDPGPDPTAASAGEGDGG